MTANQLARAAFEIAVFAVLIGAVSSCLWSAAR